LVRDEDGKGGEIRGLFHRIGQEYDEEMSFEAEMIIPSEAVDELGQKAKATISFLRYSLRLAYRADESLKSLGSLEIIEEKLEHINQKDATDHLLFGHNAKTWRKSAIHGRRSSPFISTEIEKNSDRIVKLHQDGGSSGRPISRLASSLPRTVLSATNAAESPTALIAKQEMRSWRLLQLEPSSLRKPDEFNAPTTIDVDGSHLASTLYHLARHNQQGNTNSTDLTTEQIYARVANRLSDLIEDVEKMQNADVFVFNGIW